MVETSKWDANVIVFTRWPLPLHDVSWVLPPERCVTLDEAKALMQVEGHERDEDVPPLKNVVKDLLAVDAIAQDDWVS